MSSVNGNGVRGVSALGAVLQVGNPVEQRVRMFEHELFTLAEQNASIAEIFAALSGAMKEAKTTVRGPQRDDEGKLTGKFGYVWTEDHAIRILAARTLAQMLGLIRASAGVTVNNTTQTVNVTAADRLAELDSIGVPREQIAKGCQDLLEATKGAEGTGGIT